MKTGKLIHNINSCLFSISNSVKVKTGINWIAVVEYEDDEVNRVFIREKFHRADGEIISLKSINSRFGKSDMLFEFEVDKEYKSYVNDTDLQIDKNSELIFKYHNEVVCKINISNGKCKIEI